MIKNRAILGSLGALHAAVVLDFVLKGIDTWGLYSPSVVMAAYFGGRRFGLITSLMAIVYSMLEIKREGVPPYPIVTIVLSQAIWCMACVYLGSELMRARRQLRFLSPKDALTGLLNRRAFGEAFRREIKLAHRASGWFTVVMVQVDFSGIEPASYNRLLCVVADTVSSHLRETDLVCHWSDKEIAIMAIGVDRLHLRGFADRLYQVLDKLFVDEFAGAGISMGLVPFMKADYVSIPNETAPVYISVEAAIRRARTAAQVVDQSGGRGFWYPETQW